MVDDDRIGQQAPHRPVLTPSDRRLTDFRRALDAVMVDLAQQIVRDAERVIRERAELITARNPASP